MITRDLRKALTLIAALNVACAPLTPEEVVERPEPPEAQLTAKVKAALVDAVGMSAAAILVESDASVVRLSGFVETEGERRQAMQVARGVAGVTEVRDELKVKK